MASLSRSILVIGATGLIGRFLVESLIEAQDSFDKIAIFTSLETLANKKSLVESFQSRGVGVITGNLSCEDDVLNAYEGMHGSFSAIASYKHSLADDIRLRHSCFGLGKSCH